MMRGVFDTAQYGSVELQAKAGAYARGEQFALVKAALAQTLFMERYGYDDVYAPRLRYIDELSEKVGIVSFIIEFIALYCIRYDAGIQE